MYMKISWKNNPTSWARKKCHHFYPPWNFKKGILGTASIVGQLKLEANEEGSSNNLKLVPENVSEAMKRSCRIFQCSVYLSPVVITSLNTKLRTL